MTPREKAKELVCRYIPAVSDSPIITRVAIDCALMAVEEILSINSVDKDYDLSNFWEQVKQELEKL